MGHESPTVGIRPTESHCRCRGANTIVRATHFLVALILLGAATYGKAAEPLKLLFLGDNGHHQPAARFAQLAPVMKERGIELTYSDKVEDLNPQTLGKYDGLMIYANTRRF